MTDDWTVLLIGGPGGVGKTTAAKRIAADCGAAMIPADDIWLALQAATATSDPAAFRVFSAIDVWRRPVDDLVALTSQLASRICSALENVVGTHLWHEDRVVVEGVWLTPQFMRLPNYAGSIAGARRRGVIVFDDDTTRIREGFFGRRRGFEAWPAEDRDAMVALQVGYARWLRTEALARDVPIVDARPLNDLPERILGVV